MKTVTYDENEWQLVPKISTSKMDGAGEDAYKDNGHCDCGNYDGCSMEEVYSAMLAVAPAAQDSAPAELPMRGIKTWEDRVPLCPTDTEIINCMEAEIADLRAAVAAAPASPQPAIVKADTPEYTQYECHHCGSGCTVHKLQPVAKVLDDTEIKMIAYGHRIGTEVAVKFARAILAASTPTTLTEPGNGSQS